MFIMQNLDTALNGGGERNGMVLRMNERRIDISGVGVGEGELLFKVEARNKDQGLIVRRWGSVTRELFHHALFPSQ